MHLDAPKPKRLDASCCIVDVVNGGPADRFVPFSVTSFTIHARVFLMRRTISAAFSSLSIVNFEIFFPSKLSNFASNALLSGLLSPPKVAWTDQYGFGTNASTSVSLSTTNLNAADCTLPADKLVAFGNFLQSTPLNVNPYK
jgi:hypothetical protein